MKQTLALKFSKHIAAILVLLVTAQMSEAATLPLQQEAQQQSASAPQSAPAPQAEPAAPAATGGDQPASTPAGNMPQAPAPASQQSPNSTEPGFASRSQDAQQQDAQKPVGTAAGPYARPSGVAGSRPAGAAIAPAKQRRVKAILIRVSLIVAGAAAAGAVIGLSKGSPSRP
jgi:hypothetical protein